MDKAIDVHYNKYPGKFEKLLPLKLLIIDETFMLSNWHVDFVNLLLQKVLMKSIAFGGVKVILVGDVIQLPPVRGGYAISSNILKSTDSFIVAYLKIAHRQTGKFYDFVSKARSFKNLEPIDIKWFNDNQSKSQSECLKFIMIIAHNNYVRFKYKEQNINGRKDCRLEAGYISEPRTQEIVLKEEDLQKLEDIKNNQNSCCNLMEFVIITDHDQAKFLYAARDEILFNARLNLNAKVFKNTFKVMKNMAWQVEEEPEKFSWYKKLPFDMQQKELKVFVGDMYMMTKSYICGNNVMLFKNQSVLVKGFENDNIVVQVADKQEELTIKVMESDVNVKEDNNHFTIRIKKFYLEQGFTKTVRQVISTTITTSFGFFNNAIGGLNDRRFGETYTAITRATDVKNVHNLFDVSENDFRQSNTILKFDEYFSIFDEVFKPLVTFMQLGS